MADRRTREPDSPTTRSEHATQTVSSSFALVVVDGPDRDLRCEFDATRATRVLVGQGVASDLRLTDPLVSRRHAALSIVEDAVRLTDLGSTNGTKVNGVRVHEVSLTGGELICLGATSIRLSPLGAREHLPISTEENFGRLVGSSLEMRRLYPLCTRLAMSNVPVVIEGETGTGKEVLAEAVHEQGARASGPFVVFDCTAVPPALVESELFGHERGAFTGAIATRKGVFEQAHGGTLLIDEIGDLEIGLQAKLLRALERSEIKRVGGDQWIRVDARVLAATRRDLDREVQDGRFRDDLYFRLAVGRIELPPLRERHGDIVALSKHFWRALGGELPIPYDVMHRFERYEWPGNVRELRNAVARQLAMGEFTPRSEGLRDANTRETFEETLALDLPFPRARDKVLAEFERQYVERVLAKHGGVVSRAAQASGIARRYFNIILARQNRP